MNSTLVSIRLKELAQSIRQSYTFLWVVGWLFTIGYTSADRLEVAPIERIFHGFISIVLWPIFLGAAMQ